MDAHDISETILELTQLVRGRWDNLGVLEAKNGAFATGHTPFIAPHAYLCRFYAGLSDKELDSAEAESERYLPNSYRALLKIHNGAEIMGISLLGSTGGYNLREAGDTIGQPFSLRQQNAFYFRPDYIPEGHFGIGSMNGERYSQGYLYLTSTGEVELLNSRYNIIGATWPSLSDFLRQETQRQMTLYDDTGALMKGAKKLPGVTDDWERLAKERKE